MIKITKTNWRPLIELHGVPKDEGAFEETFYFDVTKRPIIIQTEKGTLMHFGDDVAILVKESVKDILKAIDKLIAAEQDKKAQEAEEYMKATQARVASLKAQQESK